VNFDLPEIKTPSDALVAATAIMRAVAGGDLTPSEAAELSKTIDGFVRVAEVADLAERIIFRGAREPLSKLLESKRTRRKIKTQLVSMRYTSSGATQKGFQRHLKLRTNMLMKSSACRRRRSLI
jgi:hypothetical protein